MRTTLKLLLWSYLASSLLLVILFAVTPKGSTVLFLPVFFNIGLIIPTVAVLFSKEYWLSLGNMLQAEHEANLEWKKAGALIKYLKDIAFRQILMTREDYMKWSGKWDRENRTN